MTPSHSQESNRVQGLAEFLAYEPFYHSEQWHRLVAGPLEGPHPDGSLPLKGLLQGVMLRRTKAHVGRILAIAKQDTVGLMYGARVFVHRSHHATGLV